jgi:alpha-1,2-mannosyltransferase
VLAAPAQTRSRHPALGRLPGHLLGLVSWLLSLAFLVWAARLAILEGYVYEIPKGFSGDFVATLNLAFPWWFDGTNIFYGPIFVLEYRLLVAPRLLQAADFARLNFVLLGAAFVCTWLATFGRRQPRLAVVILGLWLAYHGTVEALANTAHLEMLELAMIALALVLATRRRPGLAGVALGVAVAAKTLPALFLPYLALTRRWRMLACAAAVSAGLLLAVCWLQSVSPWQGALDLLYQGGNLTDIEYTEYAYTVRADVARVLTAGQGTLSADQARLAIATHAAVGLSVMVLVGLVLVRARRARRHDALSTGVVAATMLVVAPSAHPASFIFLLPGLTAGAAEVLARTRSVHTIGLAAALAAGFIFSGFDQPFFLSQRLLGIGGVVPAHWLSWHLPTLALLTTIGALCALLVTAHRSEQAPLIRAPHERASDVECRAASLRSGAR